MTTMSCKRNGNILCSHTAPETGQKLMQQTEEVERAQQKKTRKWQSSRKLQPAESNVTEATTASDGLTALSCGRMAATAPAAQLKLNLLNDCQELHSRILCLSGCCVVFAVCLANGGRRGSTSTERLTGSELEHWCCYVTTRKPYAYVHIPGATWNIQAVAPARPPKTNRPYSI